MRIINKIYMYVPYAMLHKSPVTFYIGKVPVTLSLSDPQTSLLSIPQSFFMVEALLEGQHPSNSSHVKVGTSFILEYQGLECEVRLGRRIKAVDGDGYILL